MSNLFSLLKISPAISDSTNTIFVAIRLVRKFTILILVLKGPRYTAIILSCHEQDPADWKLM